jgi:hypothetical protein
LSILVVTCQARCALPLTLFAATTITATRFSFTRGLYIDWGEGWTHYRCTTTVYACLCVSARCCWTLGDVGFDFRLSAGSRGGEILSVVRKCLRLSRRVLLWSLVICLAGLCLCHLCRILRSSRSATGPAAQHIRSQAEQGTPLSTLLATGTVSA